MHSKRAQPVPAVRISPSTAQLGEQRHGGGRFANIREVRDKEGKGPFQPQASTSRRPKGTIKKFWDSCLEGFF